VIAEVAQAHDGSLGTAHAFIEAVAKTGADAIKFQTHIAAAESTPSEQWRVKFSRQDVTRYDYWKRMEFSEEQWHGLKQHADEKGLIFLSSPFSVEAVDLLERVGVPAWKVASGEVSTAPIFDRMLATRKPLIVSSGMSSMAETDLLVDKLKAARSDFALLQCTTAYPCPPEKIGLNVMIEYRQRHGCKVGLSDHSGTIFPGLAAATLGADVLELHVALSREMFGPDVSSSVTSSELKQLVDGIRFIEKMKAHPVDKDEETASLQHLRKLFSKSIVARSALPAGTLLTENLLALKKPGTGLPPARWASVVGARLKRSVNADQLLTDDDLES
jgi:N-acetylneuraminate synthase